MDTQADPVAPTGPPRSLVVERHRVRRPLGNLFWLLALVLLAGLAFLTSTVKQPGIEDALGKAASQHLREAGYKGVQVRVHGLDVTAGVPAGEDLVKVEDELATVPGVGMVTTKEIYRSKAQARACATLQRDLDRATGKQRIPFAGTTSRLTATGSAMLAKVAKLLKDCPSAVVIVGGHSDSHTNNFSTLSLVRARVMVTALKHAGIAGNRLIPRGYGDEFPIAQGDSRTAQLRNQRGSIAVQDR